MTSKKRQWHKAWTIDYVQHTATHTSGLVVRFERVNNEWDGKAPQESAEAAYRATASAMPQQEAAQHFTALMKQAGDAWLYAQANKEHLQADPTSRRRAANPLKRRP
jgi:hypothetical protein